MAKVFFNRGRSPKITPRSGKPLKPRVVVLFGAPGSGKTTISDILKRKGVVNSVLPLIVNEEREKDAAAEYILKPKAEILRMIRDEKLTGWETLSGNYYGLSKRTIGTILKNPGKTFIAIAGPTIIYPLREALQGKADFYQVFVKVPSVDLAQRIAARATVRDKERGIALSLETQKWLENDIGNFDFIMGNAKNKSEAAAQKLVGFLADPKNIIYDDRREASTLAVTYPYNAVEMFKDLRRSYSKKDIVLLEKQVMESIAPLIRKTLQEVRRSLPVPTDLGIDFDQFLPRLTQHIAKVLTAGIQLRSFSYQDIIANQIKLGRIGMCSSKDRALDFYHKMKKIQGSIPLEEEMLFDIVHDIGKVEDIIHHPERGYEIAKKLKMFEGLGIKGMDPEVALIAIKFSHLISSFLLPDDSLISTADEFAHDDIKIVLARKNGSVDLGRMRKLIDRICYFPTKDVSGHGDGWLRVLFSEGYFAFGDWLYSMFEKHSSNYDNAIAEIKSRAADFNMDRIVKCVAMEDMEADSKGRTFDFYRDNIVLPNVQTCLKEGVFRKADWDLVMGNLHNVSKFRYSMTQISDFLQFIGAKSEKVEDLNNFRNVFKFFVIITKSLLAFSKDPSRPDTFEFSMTHDDGSEIVYNNFGAAMDFLNDQLNLSKSDIIRSGKSIFLAPKEKGKLPTAEITEKLVNGNRIISFKLKGFHPPKA
jgi:guanylate kinase